MPVLGALARWGCDWTWSAPRAGEDVNVGAIFRLAPGLLTAPPKREGTIELVVEEREGERSYWLTASGGAISISEQDGGNAAARVSGTVASWVRALGPDGTGDDLEITGNSALAEDLLSGFSRLAARRAAARAA
jgi:hypothetical protein